MIAWIIGSSLLMSLLALVGGLTLLLTPKTLQRLLLPLVAFAAGTLLAGAMLHLLPAGIDALGATPAVFALVLAGFAVFFAIEQFLHWRHCESELETPRPAPLTYLILIGDGLHNFLGGLAVAGAFLVDVRLGIGTWLAAAAHEVPQELGDFAVLVHGGWSRRRALLFNFLSATTFLVGGLVAYLISFAVDVSFLLPFAAGNFLYIAASDLVPEVNRHHGLVGNLTHFGSLVAGMALLYGLRILLAG